MPRLTKELAVAAKPGFILYNGWQRNRDGTPLRARVNGKCQTWKTRPDDFRLPMKYGFKECFYISQQNLVGWFTTEEEAKTNGR